MDETRINNKLPIAREGFPFLLSGCALTCLFSLLGFLSLSVVAGVFSLFTAYFFRDPERNNTFPNKAVLTPADGRIIKIQNIEDPNNLLGEPAVKISIFMSIFNVHVNRIPIEGTVKNIDYHPGKFFSANLDKASEQNESNRITLQTPEARKIVFVQIAGLIARRIVCWVKDGDHMRTGQRFGLIRFGSRLEVYLPHDTQITARLGQKVSAGVTVIGYLS
ncbi:MAG: phosphatidylserine decarboxylase family protein [Deltaproteobacteria bacterium]|nr:phosphatidylserine decarboxylase family protein [Deltaproteobacteria bacterium]